MAQQKIAVFSRGIRKIAHLSSFFPQWHMGKPQRGCDEAVAGWGWRPSSRKAQQYAAKHQLPYIALEDGFIRSLGLGVEGYPPLALVWDDMGIYYDTSCPSRLEQLILQHIPTTNEIEQAQHAMTYIVEQGLSKYNHASDLSISPLPQSIVLLIDQTVGDMAVQYGEADASSFMAAFEAAYQENPLSEIWIKTHPDVLCGKKRGYFDAHLSHPRVRVLGDDIHPISLLKHVDKVYCVTSHMGFEALLCGKPVVVFGRAWYAGWGLTDDRHAGVAVLQQMGRRAPRSLVQLFVAAYYHYSCYINPNTGQTGQLDDVLHYLAQMKSYMQRIRGEIYAVGLSWWKRHAIAPFFALPHCHLHCVKTVAQLPDVPQKNSRLLVWGMGKSEYLAWAKQHQLPVVHMEDGFVRSVGLGSNLVPPLSLVIDDMGIYFNAQQPSRLEWILQNKWFSQTDLEQAKQIQQILIASKISKYNVGQAEFSLPDKAQNQRVLLVVGQVEDDASIRYGSPDIHTNAELLRTVREHHPDAFIVYKPHPDVVSGNRMGSIADELVQQWADCVVYNADIIQCIDWCDELHTMTSLAGFEALLRGKIVYCYGSPFYAHWGLTQDRLTLSRRNRSLTLLELISGALVYYPQYIHSQHHRVIDVLTAINWLQQQKQTQAQGKIKCHYWVKQWNKLRQLYQILKAK